MICASISVQSLKGSYLQQIYSPPSRRYHFYNLCNRMAYTAYSLCSADDGLKFCLLGVRCKQRLIGNRKNFWNIHRFLYFLIDLIRRRCFSFAATHRCPTFISPSFGKRYIFIAEFKLEPIPRWLPNDFCANLLNLTSMTLFFWSRCHPFSVC